MSKINIQIFLCVDHGTTDYSYLSKIKKDLELVKYRFKYEEQSFFEASLARTEQMHYINLQTETKDVFNVKDKRFGKYLPIHVFIQEWLESEIGFFCSALAISYPRFKFEETRTKIIIDDYEVKYDFNSYGLTDHSSYERSTSYLNKYCKDIPLQQTISWLLTLVNDESERYKNMRIFYNSFTNLISYNYINSLLYAILGLEALFADKNQRDKKKQLVEHITALFDKVDNKDISDMYKYRSKFVHGEMELRDYYNNDWNMDVGLQYENTIRDLSFIARDLYCNILQIFILKNKYCIEFKKDVSYKIS